jgi:hypothetical protein
MRFQKQFVAIFCLIPIAMLGCGGDDETNNSSGTDGPAVVKTEEPDNSLATPKDALRHQLELLKAGDLEKFKACFTARQQEQITAEAIKAGQEELANFTLGSLYGSDEYGEYDGQKTCKVKMENGRTLTTFIEVDGKWLADTVWFQ